MKTYCKPATVNIEDWHFNEIAVVDCFKNKRSRNDFQRLLCKTGTITKREIAEDRLSGDLKRILEAETAVAKKLTQRIINRDLQLKPIRQFQRIDGLTQKLRDICQESPEQQVFEYIGVNALKPMFRAKIMPIQYGSIPKKGGVAGKRKIERLLRKKFQGKVVAVKGDVTKAYPSATVPIVMEMLRRDIGKNKVLLWFLGALMSNYPGNHLCIGGYLPAWLFNYEKDRCMPLVLQMAIAASGITAIEFIFGLILNVWLGLNMWDYSNMPGNILGQICPQFMVLWFFLSAIGIILDDVIRWRFFGEEKPHYHLFKKGSGDK